MDANQDSLRYPIGRFDRPENPTPEQAAGWIEEIAALPFQLRAAVQGLTDAQLDTPYREGGWTLRQVMHHLADSHTHAYCRVRIAVTEPQPTVRPYDVSPALVDALYARWAALGRTLTPEQLKRLYHHPEYREPPQ